MTDEVIVAGMNLLTHDFPLNNSNEARNFNQKKCVMRDFLGFTYV